MLGSDGHSNTPQCPALLHEFTDGMDVLTGKRFQGIKFDFAPPPLFQGVLYRVTQRGAGTSSQL